MERRDWSLNALNELKDIESFDDEIKANSLVNWGNKYLNDINSIKDFELTQDEIELFLELLYKNINFMKNMRDNLKQELLQIKGMQQYIPYT